MIKLLELRTEKGLSQRETARQMNVSQGTYNNWENEKTQPSIEQLIHLARFFSVTVDYLIGYADEYGGANVGDGLSMDEKTVLRIFRTLPDESKTAFIQFLSGCIKK
jgi:transcriptional regulator with XRE-family HTH domain